jgi:hypothetical protein
MRIAHGALARRGVPLASNQVEYSLLRRQPEVNGVLDACCELGVTLIAYQPLASGALTGKYNAGLRPSGVFRRLMPNFRGKGPKAVAPVGLLVCCVRSASAMAEVRRRLPCAGSSRTSSCCPFPAQRMPARRLTTPARSHSSWQPTRLPRSIGSRESGERRAADDNGVPGV